mgnify:CR=1 FL=1
MQTLTPQLNDHSNIKKAVLTRTPQLSDHNNPKEVMLTPQLNDQNRDLPTIETIFIEVISNNNN